MYNVNLTLLGLLIIGIGQFYRTMEFSMKSADLIPSLWVPEFKPHPSKVPKPEF